MDSISHGNTISTPSRIAATWCAVRPEARKGRGEDGKGAKAVHGERVKGDKERQGQKDGLRIQGSGFRG